MFKKIWLGFWLAVSVLMLLVVLPMSVVAGNPWGFIILGALFWGFIAYVCVKKLRNSSEAVFTR